MHHGGEGMPVFKMDDAHQETKATSLVRNHVQYGVQQMRQNDVYDKGDIRGSQTKF